MKERVRLQGVALAVVMTVALLAGCAKSTNNEAPETANQAEPSNAAAEQIELEFWTINLKKNFEGYITENLIQAYEKDHPNIKIKWVDVPGAEMTKKVITSLSGDNVPDIVNETTQGLSQLVQYDAITPMSDLYTDSGTFSPYIQGMLDGVTYNNKVMALPWYNGGPLVGFINTELYQKAGLDPSKPAATYDELFAYGKQIHEKLPNVYGSNDLPLIPVLKSEGLPILSEDKKKALFNSPEHVAFIEKFVQAYKAGAIAPDAANANNRLLQQTMDNELIAQSGSSQPFVINNWEKNAPNILPKIKVVPTVTGKTGMIPISDFQLFFVPKKSKHPKEAADFALFVTSAQKQLEFCKLVAIFPSTTDTLKDAFFTEVKGDTLKDLTRKIQVESLDKLALGNLGVSNENDLNSEYLQEIQAALFGSKTTQKALDDAVAYWDAALAKS